MNRAAISFEAVFNEYQPKIERYLVRMVGQNEAEDLCQDVFLKIDRGLKSFEGKSSLSTWIYRIATNAAMDKIRSKSYKQKTNEKHFEDLPILHSNTERTSEQNAIRKEMSLCVRGFVEALPEDYRAVLILSEFEELKNKEIAEILGISLENVKIRLHRGKATLKETLQKNCDFYHDEQSILSCDRKQT